MNDAQRQLLCDPQTSGGLLLAVLPGSEAAVEAIVAAHSVSLTLIGELLTAQAGRAVIEVKP